MHGLKRFVLASKQADKKVMKNAYSIYFHIRQITELEPFKIWIGKEIFVSGLKINFYNLGLKRYFLASKQADKKVMKNAYSFYFHIRQITELEPFKIRIEKEMFESGLKNQLLQSWSETVLFSIKASRQKS